VSAIVAKILGYEWAQSDTRTRSALLVADANDGYDFEGAMAQLAQLLPPEMAVQEIFRGQMEDAAARTELMNELNQGPVLVNYAGGGSVEMWSGGLLTSADPPTLTNGPRLPFVVSMSYLDGFFHDPYTESLAESLIKAENGGALAVWASSAITQRNGQAVMNQELVRLLFNGEPMPLGEATVRAKASVEDGEIRRSWILFGDPTTILK
jgi:hypothetical protein